MFRRLCALLAPFLFRALLMLLGSVWLIYSSIAFFEVFIASLAQQISTLFRFEQVVFLAFDADSRQLKMAFKLLSKLVSAYA